MSNREFHSGIPKPPKAVKRIGLFSFFNGAGVGDRMARLQLRVLMLVLLIFGSLCYILPPETGTTLLAISLLITCLGMIRLAGNRLNKLEDELKSVNLTLECRVEERSAELTKSEESYRSILQNASDAIYLTDNTGRMIDMSKSMCKMLGYSKEELMRFRFSELVDPETLNDLPIELPAIADQPIFKERTLITRDGRKINVEINGQRVDQDRLMGVARDVTERKRIETERKEAELKFRTLAEKSMVGVYIGQIDRFNYVNPRFAKILGYQVEELLAIRGNLADQLFTKESSETVMANVRARHNGEVESVHYEVTGVRKDGSTVALEFYGNVVSIGGQPTIIGTMLDITERKKAEAELKASEQKYKLLFESNPLPLWIVAKDDLTVIASNVAAARLYGYAPKELQGMDIRQLRREVHWGKLAANYQEDFAAATGCGVIEHIKKDGTEIMVEIIAQDIVYEGRLARLSSTNDVTEKLRAEALLKASEANLQTILNNTDTAYALLNADLDIVEYNNKALIFTKNEFNFELGGASKVYDGMPEERRFQFMAYTRQVFGGQAISYESSYPQADGTALWYYVRMSPVTDKDELILGLVLAITDITARKLAEQSIRAHLEKIREMSWKQSHLIRSPLANLKGLFPLIKADLTNHAVLDLAETELERMDQILWEMAEGSATKALPDENEI